MCTTNARVMDGSKNHKQLYYRIPTAEFLSLLRRGSSVRIASESLKSQRVSIADSFFIHLSIYLNLSILPGLTSSSGFIRFILYNLSNRMPYRCDTECIDSPAFSSCTTYSLPAFRFFFSR